MRNDTAILLVMACVGAGFFAGWYAGIRDAGARHARIFDAETEARATALFDSLEAAQAAQVDSLLGAMPPGVYVYQVENGVCR